MTKELTKEQKYILLEEGTESPGTSPLNYEESNNLYWTHVQLLLSSEAFTK